MSATPRKEPLVITLPDLYSILHLMLCSPRSENPRPKPGSQGRPSLTSHTARAVTRMQLEQCRFGKLAATSRTSIDVAFANVSPGAGLAGFFKCCLQARAAHFRAGCQTRNCLAACDMCKVSNCEGSANVHLKAGEEKWHLACTYIIKPS